MSTGNAIFLVGAIFLAVSLMAISYIWRKQALGFGAVGGWILVATLGFSLSASTGDIYYMLGWFGTGLALATLLLTLGIKEARDATLEPEDDYEKLSGYSRRMSRYHRRQESYKDEEGQARRESRRTGLGGTTIQRELENRRRWG